MRGLLLVSGQPAHVWPVLSGGYGKNEQPVAPVVCKWGSSHDTKEVASSGPSYGSGSPIFVG